MKPQFSEGDWVYYNNPNHHFHMSFFQIQKIVPMQIDPNSGALIQHAGYQLVYGARDVFAKQDEILHRNDPSVKTEFLKAPQYVAQYEWTEPPMFDFTLDVHEGHEIVENTVLGKSFKYCRKCKVEVV